MVRWLRQLPQIILISCNSSQPAHQCHFHPSSNHTLDGLEGWLLSPLVNEDDLAAC